MKRQSFRTMLSQAPPGSTRAQAMLIALMLLTGCSGGGSGGSDPDGSLPSNADTGTELVNGTEDALSRLQGTWQTDCLFSGGMLPYQRLIFNVTDTVFTFDVGHFVDTQCSEAAQETMSFGTLVDPVTSVADEQGGITLNVNQVTVTPLLSQVADSFNSMSFCGIASWVPEVSMDVSGCTDTAGLIAPRSELTVFRIDDGTAPEDPTDDVLFLGDFPGGDASMIAGDVQYARVP